MHNVTINNYFYAASFSLGLVLRDHCGEFIQGKNMRFEGNVTVLEAEIKGVAEALMWLQSLAISNVDIECDSVIVFNALLKGVEYVMDVGNILDECRAILRHPPDLYVSFIKKQAMRIRG